MLTLVETICSMWKARGCTRYKKKKKQEPKSE